MEPAPKATERENVPNVTKRERQVARQSVVRARRREEPLDWFAGGNGPVLTGVPRAQFQQLKRCVDLVIASVLGVFALPLVAIICVLIRLDSPGPAVYWRTRVGKDGRCFRCFKFRSMYQDADARLEEFLSDPELGHEYARYRKFRSDPRVTRVGKILRRFSLDELMQVWNVLKGDMSIVGPRPYDDVEVPLMAGAERIIHSVRRGITGLWQVSGRNEKSFDERLALDVRYVRDRSPSLDLKILVRTIPVVLSGRGAY